MAIQDSYFLSFDGFHQFDALDIRVGDRGTVACGGTTSTTGHSILQLATAVGMEVGALPGAICPTTNQWQCGWSEADDLNATLITRGGFPICQNYQCKDSMVFILDHVS
jgi:hypothetical protein